MTRFLRVVGSLLFFVAPAFAADNYATSTVAPILPPPQPGPPYLELGPMVGHVSANDARIWVKATGAAKFALRISESGDFAQARAATLHYVGQTK